MLKHLGALMAQITGRLSAIDPFAPPRRPAPVKWRKRPTGKHAMGHRTPRMRYYGSYTMARLGLEGPHFGRGTRALRKHLEAHEADGRRT